MVRQKLWVVSELFYPVDTSTSYIMTRIAEFLADDFEVEVLTGPSQYDSVKNKDRSCKQFPFPIKRIESGNFNKNNIFGRILRLTYVTLSLSLIILKKVKPGEQVFMVTNPAFLIVIMPFLKKAKRFKLNILVHDVFPENLVTAGIMTPTNPLYSIVKNTFDWAYGKADRLVVLGIDMKRKLEQKISLGKDKVYIVQNWADLNAVQATPFETNDIIKRCKLMDKIVLTFAGNIGRLQGINELIDLIGEVENTKLHFLFIGDGAMAEKIQVLSSKMLNITYLGKQPRSKQNEFLNASHIGIVSLNDQMVGLGVPSKSYNILAAGKPILFLGNKETEIAKMVNANNLGWAFEHSQKVEIVKFLNSLKLDNCLFNASNSGRIRELVSENYSEDKILSKLKQIIQM